MSKVSINPKLFLSILSFLPLYTVFAQAKVSIKEVEKQMGNTITACGNILSIKHLENVKNKPVLINLGSANASEHLDVVIATSDSSLVGQLDSLLNQKACVVGVPFYYKGGNEFVYLKAEYLKLEEKQIIASTVFKEQPIQELSTKNLLNASHNTSLKRTVVLNIGQTEAAKRQLLIRYLKHGRIVSYRQTKTQKVYTVQLRDYLDE